jgi:hypothetical protein
LLHGTHVGLLLPRILGWQLILHEGGRLGTTWVHHWVETRRHWTGHGCVLRRHNVGMNRCFLIPGIGRFLHVKVGCWCWCVGAGVGAGKTGFKVPGREVEIKN